MSQRVSFTAAQLNALCEAVIYLPDGFDEEDSAVEENDLVAALKKIEDAQKREANK